MEEEKRRRENRKSPGLEHAEVMGRNEEDAPEKAAGCEKQAAARLRGRLASRSEAGGIGVG